MTAINKSQRACVCEYRIAREQVVNNNTTEKNENNSSFTTLTFYSIDSDKLAYTNHRCLLTYPMNAIDL